jgi:hypothetical protein
VNRSRFFRVAAPTFAAVACVMVWYASRHGLGLLPDSMTYFETARSLLRDQRLYVGDVPLTHFPPLYPLLLAAAGWLGGNLPTSARFLHCLLYGLTVIATGRAVWEASRRSPVAATIAMWCTLALAGIAQIHVTALSEPAFLVLMVAGSLALDRYLRSRDVRWLLIAGSVAAAASLTRYVGVCLILSMLAALIVLDRRTIHVRMRSAAVFGAVSCSPFLLWMIRNAVVQGTTVDRSLAFHPPGLEAMRLLVYTLSYWAWPTPNLSATVRAAMAVIMAAVLATPILLAVGRWHRHHDDPARSCFVDGVLVVFAVTYGPFLIASRTVVDAHTNFDNRILSPILITCIVLAFARPSHSSGSAPPRFFGVLPVAIWATISITNIPWTGHILAEGHGTGFGYASVEWRESQILSFVDGLGPEVAVYSNAPEVIRVLLDRPATMIPRTYSPSSGRRSPAYDEKLERMMERLASGDAVLAFFDRMLSRDYLPTPEELTESHGLAVLLRAPDGAVFNRRSDPDSANGPNAPHLSDGPESPEARALGAAARTR